MSKPIGSEIRTIKYLGPHLKAGKEPEKINLHGLSYAAMRETLVSPNIPVVFENLFLALLVEKNEKLIWKRGGVGENTELKRGYSAIFGRIFARYFLTELAGVKCLLPIQSEIPVSSYPIELQILTKNPNLPDWIGYTDHDLILAESKGSHDNENWKTKLYPTPLPSRLKSAIPQISDVNIKLNFWYSKRFSIGSVDHLPYSGWSVVSRWGTEDKNKEPWLGAFNLKPRKSKIFKSPIRLTQFYLKQFCIILALKTMGHFGNDALLWLENLERSEMNMPLLQEYLLRCTHRVWVNEHRFTGVFSIFGPFGFIPIRREINLLQIKEFILDFNDNEVFLVMMDQQLVKSIKWQYIDGKLWRHHKNLINTVLEEDFTNIDLVDKMITQVNQNLLYEIVNEYEDYFFEPITSDEIYMRNGIAMIDPKSAEIGD